MNENQQKIHYIVNLLTNGDRKKGLRQIVLLTLIYYFIKLNVFKDYDYAPTPFIWNDKIKFINISYEALKDINFLLDNGYLNEILLSVIGVNDFVVGYSIGKKIEYKFNVEDKEVIDRALLEDDGKIKDIEITDNGIIIKSKDGNNIEINITKIKKIKYKSREYKMKVSLWDTKL
ncbi:conserved protein of unknown function [Methanocaldococcus lauensis]|uniref:Uncharacterized protein n=1 Tax=Methanocaldococcus lauensis TaxID=2546128 RepID=A0A8D6SV52_9EURY|nr:hypothetical protein [Methanocaldococcus lauensis]CAB3289331.1 conserved protein of unknown function [Methanocaldococcus lauensis]